MGSFLGTRPLTDFGLGDNITSLDAAFVWGKNKKTYLFSGDQYWRYDEYYRRLDSGYPRHIRNWRGVPSDIDAVITWTDGEMMQYIDPICVMYV